jgi:hypothetical protein
VWLCILNMKVLQPELSLVALAHCYPSILPSALFGMSLLSATADAAMACSSPMTPQSISVVSPLIYKEYFPHEDIVRINSEEHKKPPGVKRRPIYFGTIHVRDGRESAVVKIDGHDWVASVNGRHINRAFSGDTVAIRLLPRGHWKVKVPPVLDLNYDSPHVVAERVDAMNVVVVFDGMPEDEKARRDALQNLKQLLFDDGFGPSQSGWISFNTVYVTVTAGFTSSHDLTHKLASARRKIVKPEHVRHIQLFTEKPHTSTSSPIATISAFSDDVSSASPNCHSTR